MIQPGTPLTTISTVRAMESSQATRLVTIAVREVVACLIVVVRSLLRALMSARAAVSAMSALDCSIIDSAKAVSLLSAALR